MVPFALPCLVFSSLFTAVVLGNTVEIRTEDCFDLPENPITVLGAVVTSSRSTGRSACYFSPAAPEQYINIQVSEMSLPEVSGSCPEFSLNEFSSISEVFIDDDDPNFRAPMVIPADPNLLLKTNCRDFEKTGGQVLRTSSPGLKLEMIFDPSNSDGEGVSYNLTLTSYFVGPSFSCPTGTFRCWDDRSKCIPESLTCDGVNNCVDHSDENNYLCTGRINGIPIPLFAIILVVSFLGLVLIVTMIVFVLRRHKAKSKQEEQTWIDMTIRPPAPGHQPLLGEKTWQANA
ncbi:unnamed protein product [Dicrocoelium dendriticum]|nr:unnamed protein product [Dicrocoelium dendriticum]